MALTATNLDHPPRVSLAGSDAVAVCNLVDLPAIGLGRIVGEVPDDLPRFDLDYLISALEQARGLAGQFPEHASVGLAFSKPHSRTGARCLIITADDCDVSNAAVVVAGLRARPAADPCAGCPGVEGGCQESPVECGRLAKEGDGE